MASWADKPTVSGGLSSVGSRLGTKKSVQVCVRERPGKGEEKLRKAGDKELEEVLRKGDVSC